MSGVANAIQEVNAEEMEDSEIDSSDSGTESELEEHENELDKVVDEIINN